MKYLVQLCRILVGVTFIISGMIKLNDPMGFSFKLEDYFAPGVLNLPFLVPYALAFAIFVCIFEVVLGVTLLVGYKKKLTLWLLLAMLVFFGFLTFYSAYFNKVTDCGCFGDAIKFTPWQSFTKDLVLLALTLVVFFGQKYIHPLTKGKLPLVVTCLSVLFCIIFVYYVYNHLPVKDFRVYKIGTNIPKGMELPPNAVTYYWTFKINGKQKMSQPDTPEQPDTESQKTAVPQPEMQPETSSETPSEPQEPAQWQPEKHRFGSIGILAASAIGVVLALYAFRLPPFGMGEVYTNNAYVRGSVTAVSPRVGGYVQKVLVRDFDNVKAGQPLVEIDPAPYRAKVAQAEAGLAGQQAALNKTAQDKASALAVSKANQAAIDNARAQLDRARREWQRIQAVSADAVSQSSRDAAQTAVKQAEAGLKQAQEQYAVAQQNIINTGVGREGAQAGIANAQALLDLAKQDLGHTVIYAPASGKLGEVSIKQGQLVSAGTQLMSVVPPERWIIANIKETDMANVKIGQSASVSIDALGGKAFSGKVAEISPATASEFSLIKADSGTGNFVKIAQRIAVKIVFDAGQQDLERLAPGMSAEVNIATK